jgi:general transcription factor 3C polypeptide 3 (transcription factor C subunit 4)
MISAQARNALLSILKRYPHDLTVLSELRPILVDLSDFFLCASLYQGAFDHYQSLYPSGVPRNPSTNYTISADVHNPQFGCIGLLDLLVLADLYNSPALAAYDRAITVIRRGYRWLQGRGTQKFWDSCEDDREYDLPGSTRSGRERPGFFELEVNARQRLAVARIKMGDIQEGKVISSPSSRAL